MNYHEAADFLFDLRRFRMRPGTDTTARLLSHLGDPHEGPTYVQIAGTNGKGSTARMTERILRAAGLDVGLYTSPHVEDVRERIRVNGRAIPKAAIVEYAGAVREYVTERAAAGDGPTFFEALTGLALWQFGREDVDVAVLEVGIGGRYDATSVVDPAASAVTAVDLEHTAILGETIGEIARDMAHVAPERRPLVTAAEGEALAAVREQAGDVLRVGDGDVAVRYGGVDTERARSRVDLDGGDWSVAADLPLPGAHQAENAGVAAALARQVAAVSEAEIQSGLEAARLPGRFEVIEREPLVVLDGAHNPAACEALAGTLDAFGYDDLHLVFGAMHDKDHGAMAAALPAADRVNTCEADPDRAADGDVLAAVFRGTDAEVSPGNAVESALDRAIGAAGPDDCVLATGSMYVVREARRRFTRVEVPKRIGSTAEAREVLKGAHVTDAGIERMAEKGVHRALKARVQPRQARYLKEELLALGGECAVSGLVEQDEELVDVVMLGTVRQFRRLTRGLGDQPYGLASVGASIRRTLGFDANEPGDLPWATGTTIMGILNVTPDSFHDGGLYEAREDAVAHAEEMIAAGADIVDVGGESTRPGADPVPVEEEIDRVVPVIEAVADMDVAVSVDTRKAAVAEAALGAGADILNDVSGLEDPDMPYLAAEHDAPLVVMHSIETPVDPDREVRYDDVVEDVIDALRERILIAEKAGLDRDRILVDPGLGFGKTAAESFELLGRLGEVRALGCPIMVGHSHKSMFGAIDRYPDEGGYATVAATALAAERGADVIRVHDVPENVAAVRAVDAAARGTDE